ncbi:MAG: GNAT family N-acetyltransferase, partial [Chloroflexota bacterium]|nr:GNAT family N-acetyltransferase [Chloroflexota bacterium]
DWEAPHFNLATDNWVVLSPQGNIVGASGIWHREHVIMMVPVNVHPDYVGMGVGTALLRKAEERARQLMVEAPEHARITMRSGTISTNQDAKQRLEREGFTLVRSIWKMETEMDEAPPVPIWPEGIAVRTFVRGQDERTVFEADEEAFQDHWGHVETPFDAWEHWMIKRKGFEPSLWFLAYDGNEVAGFSLCRYEQNNENSESNGWVETLGVRRPWRHLGLGTALLYHSFGEFYRRGIRKVGLDVDSQNLTGAVRLYERVGMHAVRQYDSYEKELRSGVELSKR